MAPRLAAFLLVPEALIAPKRAHFLMTEPRTLNQAAPEYRTVLDDPRIASWIRQRGRSLLREMVDLVASPDMVSLAGGLPDCSLFPGDQYVEALSAVAAEDPRAFQYGPVSGELKEQVVEVMKLRGVECSPAQILLVSGAQQGINLLAQLFLEPRGRLALEEYIYTGAQEATAPRSPRIDILRTDLETGLDTEQLQWLLCKRRRPSLAYVITDAHNPLGVSLSAEKRAHLVALASEHRFPIIEDDPYGLLHGDRPFELPLLAHDDSDSVFYVGSFSKILAPGLRLGWVVVPEFLVPRLSTIKESVDLESSGLTQRAVCRLLSNMDLPSHLERLRQVYTTRRSALLRALEEHMPSGAEWTRPEGGMFVWVRLPEGTDTLALLHRCLKEQRVAFVPGAAFAVAQGEQDRAKDEGEPAASNCLRLSCSTLEPEQIDQAVGRLAATLDHS